MKRWILAGVAATLGLALSAGPAAAQRAVPYAAPNYGPGYRTPLSPYLNLVPFNDPARPAVNYFLGTIPEFQRRSNAQLFQSEIRGLQARPPVVVAVEPADQDLFRPINSSGHPTAFANTLTYFGSATPRPGGSTPAPPPRPGRAPRTGAGGR